ncbi:MAG: hypothetical protein ACI9N9_001200 [Enterobacterales bacterium]
MQLVVDLWGTLCYYGSSTNQPGAEMKFTVTAKMNSNINEYSLSGLTQSKAIQTAKDWAQEEGFKADVFITTYNDSHQLVYLNEGGLSSTGIKWGTKK